jgi:hypothetical protein
LPPVGVHIGYISTNQEAIMISSTGSATNARDFSKRTTDPHRDDWNAGAMHHLVQALGDSPVAIVLDKATGFTEVGVTLGGVRQTPGYGTYQVLVQRVHSDGTTSGCWFPLFKVGTVIELKAMGNAHYTALSSYAEEKTRAVRRLQDEMMAELSIQDRYQLPKGTWNASVFNGFVHVSFQPESFTGPVEYRWERYASSVLATA